MKKSCEQCGRYFERVNNAQRYCCVECREAGNKEKNGRAREMRRIIERAATQENKSLIGISVEARNAGMTYGQYVAKYGL